MHICIRMKKSDTVLLLEFLFGFLVDTKKMVLEKLLIVVFWEVGLVVFRYNSTVGSGCLFEEEGE